MAVSGSLDLDVNQKQLRVLLHASQGYYMHYIVLQCLSGSIIVITVMLNVTFKAALL